MIREEAFEELLDRAALAEEEGEATGAGEERRRQFALEVDRAVKRALTSSDDETWHTQTMRRFKCRLYFFRHLGALHLVGCVPLDREEVSMA